MRYCFPGPTLHSLLTVSFFSSVDNKLNSTIPVELSELEALETLFLDENELTGSIPSGFGNILELKVLSLCKSLCCYALWREIRKDTLCFFCLYVPNVRMPALPLPPIFR